MNTSSNSNTLRCGLLAALLLTQGCDKLKLPAPDDNSPPATIEEPTPVVTPNEQPAPAPMTPLAPPTPEEVIAAFLAKPTHERTDEDLTQLAALPSGLDAITELDLTGSRVTIAGMTTIEKLPAVRSVNISNTRMGDAGVKALAKLPQLEELGFQGIENVTDVGVSALVELPKLQSVDLSGTAISEAAVTTLAEIPELKVLRMSGNANLNGTSFTIALKAKKFDQLEELAVAGTDFGYYGLNNIGSLKNLKVLRAGHTNVSDGSLKTLAMCRELRILDIPRAGLSDDGIKQIVRLKNLEELNLSDSNTIQDITFNQLKVMKHLKILNVNNTSVTEAAVKKLKEDFLKTTTIIFQNTEY